MPKGQVWKRMPVVINMAAIPAPLIQVFQRASSIRHTREMTKTIHALVDIKKKKLWIIP